MAEARGGLVPVGQIVGDTMIYFQRATGQRPTWRQLAALMCWSLDQAEQRIQELWERGWLDRPERGRIGTGPLHSGFTEYLGRDIRNGSRWWCRPGEPDGFLVGRLELETHDQFMWDHPAERERLSAGASSTDTKRDDRA